MEVNFDFQRGYSPEDSTKDPQKNFTPPFYENFPFQQAIELLEIVKTEVHYNPTEAKQTAFGISNPYYQFLALLETDQIDPSHNLTVVKQIVLAISDPYDKTQALIEIAKKLG